MTSIHGVVVARDEWGILAVAITHALTFVDVVHVLDHGSTDQTASGLDLLVDEFGERLRVYRASPSTPYDQRLLTSSLISLAEADGADWIYVFDADEFLVSPEGFSLGNLLTEQPDDVVAVQYRVANFISLRNFDKLALSGYRGLRFRARPGLTVHDPDSGWNALYSGEGTFFDMAFPPKIIVRARSGTLLAPGAHRFLVNPGGGKTIDCAELECAHVTFATRDSLDRKSAMGRHFAAQGFPRSYGWQSQLLALLETEGRLDWFWERHSINVVDGVPEGPRHTEVDTLAIALEPTLARLDTIFGQPDIGRCRDAKLSAGLGPETPLTVEQGLTIGAYFNSRVNAFLRGGASPR